MREIIAGRLWIGNALEARKVTDVLACGVEAIIDLAIEEIPLRLPRDIVYCRFPLVDGAGNSRAVLRAALATTIALVTAQVPMLVVCGAGMSRSPVVVAAALAMLERVPFSEVLKRVASLQPHDVSPSLVAEVEALCTELCAQREREKGPTGG